MAASVVLNGARSSARVSDATRNRIMEVAARLQYRPNAVARGLLKGRLNMIGVVGTVYGGNLDVYFHEILNGILETATDNRQNTSILSVHDWEGSEDRVLEFCDGRVDGLIFIAPRTLKPEFAKAIQRSVPFVTIHSNASIPGVVDMEADDEGGAYQAVQYLVALGHRKIAFFPGELYLSGSRRRLEGYKRCLAENGIAYDDRLVIPGWYTYSSGQDRMAEMLERDSASSFPTALFCANDAIAFGCMEILAKYRLRVPDDISVVGFDDTLNACMTIPALTTVRQPLREMGRRSAARLIDLVQRRDTRSLDTDATQSSLRPGQTMDMFPVELIVRGTAGPPPALPVIPRLLERN